MSKRKAPEADLGDLDEFAAIRTLSRKQVGDMIRRKESLVEADLRGCDLSGLSFDGVDLTAAKFGEANLSKCETMAANAKTFAEEHLRTETMLAHVKKVVRPEVSRVVTSYWTRKAVGDIAWL